MPLFDVRNHEDGYLEVLTEIRTGDGAGETWEPYAEHWLRHRQVELPRGTTLVEVTWLEELQREGWAHPRDFMGPVTQPMPLLKLPEPAETDDHWDDDWIHRVDDIDHVGAAILILAALGLLTLTYIIGLGLVELIQQIT